jgi:hypothetical protein
MALNTRDASANANEYIARTAAVLGRSKDRINVFNAIYRGAAPVKTVSELMKETGLSRVRVLQEGGKLDANEIVDQERIETETAYRKRRFIQHHKKKILSLAANRNKLNAYPTKWNQATNGRSSAPIKVTLKQDKARILQITVDDIATFNKVKSVPAKGHLSREVSESQFKSGIRSIARELGEFKDWGGEINDLFTTQLVVDGKRRAVAFGFKGPGTRGKLTPGKMGKNGDQIQRLFESPAEVFIVQYCGDIDQSVLKQMESHAIAKSVYTGQQIYFGIINGIDSDRLLRAYKRRFLTPA